MDRRDLCDHLELRAREVRHPDMAQLAGLAQFDQSLPTLDNIRRVLEIGWQRRPVNLIEVNPLDSESAQTCLHLGTDRGRLERVKGNAVGGRQQATFSKEV